MVKIAPALLKVGGQACDAAIGFVVVHVRAGWWSRRGRWRGLGRFLKVRASLGPVGPADAIVCVDCGGRCQRLPFDAPELGWQVGDVVTYRCRDCADVWYLEVVVDDLVQRED